MKEQNPKKSALNVMQGVEKPQIVNSASIARFKARKQQYPGAEQLAKDVISGNMPSLGKAITLVESSKQAHLQEAQKIINLCMPHSGKSVRIGFTGVPGVGKSTFIEAVGMRLIKEGRKVAVLAIDPSSKRSGGSILGDKTRMEQLSANANAFIRPSPSAGTLGGVARKTAESAILCEAAGFDVIFIETVGVGQSEIAVHSMVDFFLLLMLAGAGDELQGIKRGIMEMADMIVINKAEGDNIAKANRAKAEYQNALHLFPPSESGWTPKVLTASAIAGNGIPETWQTVEQYIQFTQENGYFYKKRNQQAKFRMYEMIEDSVKRRFYANQEIHNQLAELEQKVLEGTLSPYFAAQKILTEY